MAPRSVLRFIPPVGRLTCRLDRLPKSRGFSLNVRTCVSGFLIPGWDLRRVIVSPLSRPSCSSMETPLTGLSEPASSEVGCSSRASYGNNGDLLARTLVGVEVVAQVRAVLLSDNPGQLLHSFGGNTARVGGSLVQEQGSHSPLYTFPHPRRYTSPSQQSSSVPMSILPRDGEPLKGRGQASSSL